MKSFKRTGLLAAVVTLTCLIGFIGTANAALISYICDDALCTGGNDTVVTDQGPGDNFPGSALPGQINSGALNFSGFTVVTNIGQSKPLIGSSALPQLDLGFSVTTNDSVSHTIFLYVSDTGFTGAGTINLTFGGNQLPAGVDSVTARAWGGNSNSNLDLSNLLAIVGPSSLSPFNLSATGALSPTVNPYSVTLGLAITRTAAGTTAGGLNVTASPRVNVVPEPGSLLLLALGTLALMGALGYRSAKS